jgi:hypothetical protein
VFVQPPQHLHVPAFNGLSARMLIPPAVVRPRPLQHLQMPALSGPCTRCALAAWAGTRRH